MPSIRPFSLASPRYTENYKEILKVLLPRVAPDETVSQHTTSGKKALARLMQIGDGNAWEAEMEKFVWGSLFSTLYVPELPVEAADTTSRLF